MRAADEACQRRSTIAKKAGNEAASSQSNRRRPFLPATSQLRRFSAHSAHDRRARTGPHLPQAGEGVGPDVFGRVSPRADEKGQILDFFPRRSSSSRHPPSASRQRSAGGSTKRVTTSVVPMYKLGSQRPRGGPRAMQKSSAQFFVAARSLRSALYSWEQEAGHNFGSVDV